MKEIRKFGAGISHMRVIFNLAKWAVNVLLALAVPAVFAKTGGWTWGTPWLLAWVIFARVLWVRQGLKGIFFGDKNPRQVLNDVSDSSARLAHMATPYILDSELLRRPVFVGMAQDGRGTRRPTFLPPDLIRKNFISFLGASGTGKTKLSTLILCQMLREGDAVVCFDPKDDEFQPGTLISEARKLGRPVVYVNMREPVAQINPFKSTTRAQREQLLQTALQLDPSGNPSVDFHRGEDRDASAALISTGLDNILDLVGTGSTIKAVTGRINFWRELRDLARLEAFHTEESPDLLEVIQAGGLIYIVGDTDDLRIVAGQRLMLARVLQIIKGRERVGARQVSLFLEEFKYSISNAALRALGTIRDRRCNLMLAYQSYGDLEDCGTLPPKAVLGAAKGNTTLKFVFKLEDGNTAKEFSAIAGEHSIMVESIGKTLDDNGMETGQWREANRAAVTVDMLTTNMPKPLAGQASVCWVFGLGPAFPISTMHLPAGPRPQITKASSLPPLANDHLNGQAAIGLEEPRPVLANALGDVSNMSQPPVKPLLREPAALDFQELI